MTPFWEGVLAGYGIAIPVGAIAVLIVDMGLRRGFGLGFMAGAGAAAADLVYASLAALAGEALASLLTPFSLSLRIASALVMVGRPTKEIQRTHYLLGKRQMDGLDKAYLSFARTHRELTCQLTFRYEVQTI